MVPFTPMRSVLAVGIVVLASVSLYGQSRETKPLPGGDVAKALAAKLTVKGFVPPKTPWGDPDVQGNFTYKDESNTPMERPEEFKDRSMDGFTKEEMAKIVAQRQAEAFDSALFAFGGRAEGIAIGVPVHWMDHISAKNTRPWFMIDPPDGKIPPASEAARKRAAAVAKAREGRGPADSFMDRSLSDRCIQRTIPAAILPGQYGNSVQILQTKDSVVIRNEMVHEARIIPLDGRPHLGPRNATYFGDSRGHFEGSTLVVETTNFDPRMNYRNASPQLRTIERFTRTAPNKVEWTVTIVDPDTWDRPWTYSMPYTEDDGQMILEYACHEGNYAIQNILTAQRSDEVKGVKIKTGAAGDAERSEEIPER